MYNPDKLRHSVLACLSLLVGAMIFAAFSVDNNNVAPEDQWPVDDLSSYKSSHVNANIQDGADAKQTKGGEWN